MKMRGGRVVCNVSYVGIYVLHYLYMYHICMYWKNT